MLDKRVAAGATMGGTTGGGGGGATGATLGLGLGIVGIPPGLADRADSGIRVGGEGGAKPRVEASGGTGFDRVGAGGKTPAGGGAEAPLRFISGTVVPWNERNFGSSMVGFDGFGAAGADS